MDPSVVKLLIESCRRNAERVALEGLEAAFTYAELAEAVESAAAALASLETANGRYGLLLPNGAAFPIAYYGALRAGRSVVMLNPLNSRRENTEQLSDASVDTVITIRALRNSVPSSTRAVLMDEAPDRLLVMDGGEAHALAPAGAVPPIEALPSGDDEATILYTAANDGWARGAVLSHRNLCANLRSTIEAMAISADDRIAAALPLVHAFGLTVTLNAALIAGARVRMVERFHPARMLDQFAEQRISLFAGVPAMYLAMLAAVERWAVPDHALRITLAGGAPLPAEVAVQWEKRFGLPLRQGYGLTEASPVCAFNRVDRPNRPGTIGLPFPGVEIAMMAADGKALPSGEVGELCVRGENVFSGYLKQPEATAAVFHGDWLRTGDLASIDADGYITFRGMLKPMFTRNGFNVYPREIERVLEQDARIERARVSAQPEAAREHDIVVTVQPAARAEISADDVREICKERLAAYKQPSRIDLDPMLTV